MTQASVIVDRKQRALDIRQRIESLATVKWADISGQAYDTLSHSHVRLRLHLLISNVEVADQHRMLGAVIALANAYGATSNMIHGRSSSAKVQRIQFDEWEELLEYVESAAFS